MNKSIFVSKTFWTNVLAFIAAMLGAFNVTSIGPEEQAALVAGIMAVVNIILRVVTKTPVSVPGIRK